MLEFSKLGLGSVLYVSILISHSSIITDIRRSSKYPSIVSLNEFLKCVFRIRSLEISCESASQADNSDKMSRQFSLKNNNENK